jgi:hypothetical protein
VSETTTVPTPAPAAAEEAPLSAATTQVLDIVSSGSATPEQVQQAVAAALDAGLSPQDAAALISNGAVVGSLTTEQAAKVIAAIHVGKLDTKQKAKLGTALSKASPSVKSAFEKSVDVYGGGVDTYVPTGSNVDVGKRRTLVAAAAVTGGLAAGAAGRGASGSGGAADGDDNRRKNSYGLRPRIPERAESTHASHSAARRVARKLGQKNSATSSTSLVDGASESSGMGGLLVRILRQILRELGPMSFTLAGSVIVLTTLSGHTKKIALIATIVAVSLHFGHVVMDNIGDKDTPKSGD